LRATPQHVREESTPGGTKRDRPESRSCPWPTGQFLRETQIAGAHFEQLVAGAQAGDGQQRVDSCSVFKLIEDRFQPPKVTRQLQALTALC
jgi:hypothetical protein